MGWCSGTRVFDRVMDVLIGPDAGRSTEDVIRETIMTLQDMDWDCESDSDYWEHPLVQKVFRELHPDWFEDE